VLELDKFLLAYLSSHRQRSLPSKYRHFSESKDTQKIFWLDLAHIFILVVAYNDILLQFKKIQYFCVLSKKHDLFGPLFSR
jgi:hypothetical protein